MAGMAWQHPDHRFFFSLLTSLAAREFGEVVITSVLRKTPLEVTVIVMLLLATLSSRNNQTTFTYIHHFYLPLIVFPCILIVALSLKNAQLTNLQPLWGNEPHGMLSGMLTIAGLFQGSFIHTIVIPAMRRPEKAMQASVWGMIIAGGLYFSIVTAAVGVFGPEETKLLLWPTLELAKTTALPGNILERLDAAFLAVWVTAVFTTLFSSYYLTIRAISRLFRLRDQKMLSLFILPFLFVLAMIPQNILHMYEIIVRVGQFGLLITIVYPMFLLLVAVIRRKRGRCMTVCRQSKTASLLLVFLLTIPMLTGCWDRQEIEERAVVLGIGIDTADPEEKKCGRGNISPERTDSCFGYRYGEGYRPDRRPRSNTAWTWRKRGRGRRKKGRFGSWMPSGLPSMMPSTLYSSGSRRRCFSAIFASSSYPKPWPDSACRT